MRNSCGLILALVVVASACGKKSGDAGKSGGAPAVDFAAIANAAVPAAAKASLVFENASLSDDGENMSFARPKGWTVENKAFPGKFKPPATPDLGFMTSFSVGTGCDGGCEPKDWKAVVEKQMKNLVKDGPNAHEEALPNNGRIRWDVDGDKAHVIATWWKEGDRHYRDCIVWLDNAELAKSVDAFVAACKNVRFE
ncbi:MAG TPA: hypothetical protein PLF40_14820 [Kofleriaceae bacterium]|nr:hypothetical protein [Kofleriaceae bacterium]